MTTTRSLLDRGVVRRAVLVTVVLGVPPLVIVRVLESNDLSGRPSDLWIVAMLAVTGAYAIGGMVAAASSREMQLTHSAGGAGYALGLMALGSAVVALAQGGRLTGTFVLVLVMMAMLGVSAAVLGGYAVMRGKNWKGRRR